MILAQMLEKSKRILIFTTAFRPLIGGSEIAIEEISRRLPDIFFDIVTPRYHRLLQTEERQDNVFIHRVGWGWKLDKFFLPIRGFLKARQLMGNHGYKIIHAYQASYGAAAAWLTKLFYPRVKLVLTLQEGNDLEKQSYWIRFLRKIIIKKADAVTAISNYLKSYSEKINRRSRVAIIPNGVNFRSFSHLFSYGELSALAEGLGIRPGEKLIISVSRLVYKNGLDQLIQALALLCSPKYGSCEVKLLLAGDGQQKKELQTLAQVLGVADKVIFAGSINNADLPKYLQIADVFVRPSRSEGLGNSFLEAMAASVPVIATPVGGIPDFLKDGETGLFCEVDSPTSIARQIKLLLDDKKLREIVVKNARKLVRERYSWKKISQSMAELYQT